MELVAIVVVIALLLVTYFCFGMLLKFIWGWWILLIATPVCIAVGIFFGWIGAIAGLIGFILVLHFNDIWHGNPYYLAIVKRIEKAFYLGDT